MTTHRYRTHTCGALTADDAGNNVRLSGWVHRIRDHGGLLFIDLRDNYGITQCVIDPDSAAFADAEKVRSEWVLRIDGEVKLRDAAAVNTNIATGGIEIFIREIEVLSVAKELPLPVFGDAEYPEDIRLRYRFLDLRREKLHANILKRTKVISAMRAGMGDAGFTEFSTPILTASSPEGARDFLVPSRIHPGKFFALPQAPQQYKQLLMVAGFDRYFQVAPCFRDEDPRADRLPGEFYQLDLEMSFVTQEDVWNTVEPVITNVFEKFADGKRVTKGWKRIPYWEAIRKYGSDKPDLRNPIEMADTTPWFRGSGFKVFANQIEADDKVQVWAIPAKNKVGAEPIGRAFCDRMNAWAQGQGQPGLGYIFFKDGQGSGPIAKNIGEERTNAIRDQLGLVDGDAVFFVCGVPRAFYKFAGEARNKVGFDLDLVDTEQFSLCWVVDFPFYEWNEEEKRIDFAHNPFSMPQGGLEALNTDSPLELLAYQYDAVCNGYEIASGSIRNQEPETMVKAFELTGKSREEVEEQFGGLYRAFQYGAPPHGGAAFGIDRIVMLLCGVQNLREITAFPMNQQAEDLLMGAPSPASAKQMRELSIRLNVQS
ncbi:aspartyl-tRNA synthetase [Devosia riboflavina]|uniref:Aspartate--tRNA(Asp/Asn) ligase n=1 Tax=Devosia riboflavina TaxID=46914 RepID=A0A087M6E9_9HYPH|nr:aspartate--tRNA ligase [Devosia riboflavina]KFL32452.1 aspartyl-tRNA synthetase [Devosia riboflavina]